MAVFLITYDLVAEKSGHDYEPLWEELGRVDAVKSQLSAWLLAANNTQKEVLDHFRTFVDDDDRLMVIQVSKKPSFSKALKGTNAFLDEHFGN
ncbi:CRISPR-associated protein Cas2 [Sphingomonas parva]|uniref:CRISPR-associated protein Cas2 n=1 Tax=Sphingomonas parva TaxID=2555898 RepID=A0A4Y8ZQW4_9SPHN|nr:CRISPR-associated protein Cas2 [Sphingomonas parva]TFI58418.1 CRISPR-associated protein Cas2 [Sphingomonas parva]